MLFVLLAHDLFTISALNPILWMVLAHLRFKEHVLVRLINKHFNQAADHKHSIHDKLTAVMVSIVDASIKPFIKDDHFYSTLINLPNHYIDNVKKVIAWNGNSSQHTQFSLFYKSLSHFTNAFQSLTHFTLIFRKRIEELKLNELFGMMNNIQYIKLTSLKKSRVASTKFKFPASIRQVYLQGVTIFFNGYTDSDSYIKFFENPCLITHLGVDHISRELFTENISSLTNLVYISLNTNQFIYEPLSRSLNSSTIKHITLLLDHDCINSGSVTQFETAANHLFSFERVCIHFDKKSNVTAPYVFQELFQAIEKSNTETKTTHLMLYGGVFSYEMITIPKSIKIFAYQSSNKHQPECIRPLSPSSYLLPVKNLSHCEYVYIRTMHDDIKSLVSFLTVTLFSSRYVDVKLMNESVNSETFKTRYTNYGLRELNFNNLGSFEHICNDAYEFCTTTPL